MSEPFFFNLMPNEEPPLPPKWIDWPLPPTFEHGDVKPLPPGVGIVKLGPNDSF